jgi:hypothetical protein
MLAKNFPYSLCLNQPSMTVITINKVQTVYNTPVYDCEEDLNALNKHIDLGTKINLEFYRANQFSAVHIGDFVTEPIR